MIKSDYLYIWNDVETGSIIASGLKLIDFLPSIIEKSGVILLKHCYENARQAPTSAFSYIEIGDIQKLLKDDVYSWGDFYWVDYSTNNFPSLNKEDISELIYFSENALPKSSTNIPSLGNDFMVAAHDDGWYVRVFYSDWNLVCQLLDEKAPELTVEQRESLHEGESGFWIQDKCVRSEDKTFDVDVVINRNLVREGQTGLDR